ncbi:Predicted DNA-binding transcriptional regulator YafY, contains an HTH and WYL domains [Dethiosulfatibacter aminovorans DSM 17477]|uniref:Predicted DNA-binding transcriptional regulator YafY, contains an HTH and WYL domains n=2 Tax=Dethiosulfatibacter TaxID=448125 RepID=A0A1M6C9K2_9FIRM|nr:Predicted DNA-binding transcriptional regulator YafY, contains an HTH and WYL domains [Dethiosulfatibacter aminovorans DSM 17477]
MGELSNSLKMLAILSSRGKMKSQELADMLGVTRRQVQRYKKELTDIGVDIKTERGKNGGYHIEQNVFLNTMVFDPEDRRVLDEVARKLETENSEFKNDFRLVYDKLIAYMNHNEYGKGEKFSVYMEFTDDGRIEHRKMILDIQSAIYCDKKIDAAFKSGAGRLEKDVFRPMKIVYRNGDAYLVSFSESTSMLKNIRIEDIVSIEVMEDRFNNGLDMMLKDHVANSFLLEGVGQIRFKLKIESPYSSIASLKTWSSDQLVVDLHDGSIYFEATACNRNDVVDWVLSMRDGCSVLEPEELKNEVRDIIMKMQSKV